MYPIRHSEVHYFTVLFLFVLRPMILLALGVAVLNLHTRLAHLETVAPLLTALGTADVYLVHRDTID